MTKKSTFLADHTILRALLMMLCISAAALIVIFFLLKVYGRTGREYELADMRGMTLAEAAQSCPTDVEFVVNDSIYVEGDEGGHIINHDPRAGSKVKKGRKVFVSISAYAPKDALMPDLTDVTVKQAVSQLSSMGFSVGRIKMVQSQFPKVVLEATCRGRVLQPGATVGGGSVIDLTVGLDPERPYGVVPFVLGKSPEKARRDIKMGAFNVGTEHFEHVQDRAKAVVVKQKPAYTGVSQHTMGSSVELWYSDDPTLDVDKLINEYEVDPNDIIALPEEPEFQREVITDDEESVREW